MVSVGWEPCLKGSFGFFNAEDGPEVQLKWKDGWIKENVWEHSMISDERE